MKDDFRKDDWARRLRPFDKVWGRVQGAGPHRPPPPPPGPPFVPGPPPPPGPPIPPPPGPPIPPPKKPCKNCCTKAVRFNPWFR